MGTETSPDVDESTEPPLRSSLHEGPTNLLRPSVNAVTAEKQQHCHLEHAEKASKATEHTQVETAVLSTPAGGECGWADQYQYAHTFAPSDISWILAVDLQ